MGYAYIVDTLDGADYTADELSQYLSEFSGLQHMRLVTIYIGADGRLNIVWEDQVGGR